MGHHDATEKEIKQIREEEVLALAVLGLFVFGLSICVHFNQHGTLEHQGRVRDGPML